MPMSALQRSSATSPINPALKTGLCIAATLLLIVPLLMVEADARMGGGGGGRGFGGGGFGGGRGFGGGGFGGGRSFGRAEGALQRLAVGDPTGGVRVWSPPLGIWD